MPTAEQLVEIVTFRESGTDEISAKARAMGEQFEQARARAEGLAGALNDPSYKQHGQRMAELARLTERTKLAIQNQTRAADLSTGAFYRHAQSMVALNRQSAAIARQEHLQSLVATHGRWGAVLKANEARLATLKSVGIGAWLGMTGLAVGLVRTGLQGTVEGYRMEMAWTRLGRSVAGVAVPALDKIAVMLNRVTDWFNRLNGPQQDFLLKIGLIGVVAGPAIAAMSRLLGVVTAIYQISKTTALVSAIQGMGAAASAAAAGTAAAGTAGGLGTAAATAGAAGVAGGFAARGAAQAAAQQAARQTAASIVIPALATAAMARAGSGGLQTLGGRQPLALPPGPPGVRVLGVTANAPMMAGAAAAPGFLARNAGWMGMAAKIGGGIALANTAYEAATGGFYDRLRQRGNSWEISALGAIGGGLMDTFTGGSFGDHFRKANPLIADRFPRRDVTPLGAANEEAGAAHFRIQEELLKISAAKALEEEEQARKKLIEQLEREARARGGDGFFDDLGSAVGPGSGLARKIAKWLGI